MTLTDFMASPLFTKDLPQNPRLVDNNNEDQKERFEKDFCKDFRCCGIYLDNLHQLVDHYEIFHLDRNISQIEKQTNPIQMRKSSFLEPQIKMSNLSIIESPNVIRDLGLVENPLIVTDLKLIENPNKLNMSKEYIQTVDTMMNEMNAVPCHNPTFISQTLPIPKSPIQQQQPTQQSQPQIQQPLAEVKDDRTRDDNDEEHTDKRYRCDVKNCDKSYKNSNGLKYHRLHGHCSTSETDLDDHKPFVCSFDQCEKRYKNLNGLKYHMEHSHQQTDIDLSLSSSPTQLGVKRKSLDS